VNLRELLEVKGELIAFLATAPAGPFRSGDR
jgi:hypothetical protein